MDSYILSKEEMKFLGYYLDNKEHFFATNINTNGPTFYYLDCEFVDTDKEPNIVVIGIGNLEKEYKFTVKPKDKVTDYITNITGIDEDTEYDKTFEEAIIFLQNLICKEDILIGHHLYNDLILLNFYHPYIVDTCLVFSTPDGPPIYYSLKELSLQHLKKTIQVGSHCPLEDARTSYELIKFCIDKGYVKMQWSHFNEIFEINPHVDMVSLVSKVLNLNKDLICNIYCRGSRPIGTNRPDSDYDLVVICDNNAHVIEGTIVRCGNMDICLHSIQEFMKYIEFQYIWALECLYAPNEFRYIEKINFVHDAEEFRKKNLDLANDYLTRSIGYETARKIVSAKRHFLDKNIRQSKKHVFIAARFANFGYQIVKHGKIMDIKGANFIWEFMKNLDVSCDILYSEYEDMWKDIYVKQYRKFSYLIPKKNNKKKEKKEKNYKLYNHVSMTRNCNVKKLVVSVIQNGDDEDFLDKCPIYAEMYHKMKKKYEEFIAFIMQLYKDVIGDNDWSRIKFCDEIQKYNKRYHKYLFSLYDKKNIRNYLLQLSTKKVCNDIMMGINNDVTIKYQAYGIIPKEYWIKYQNDNKSSVVREDSIDINNIKYIGGLDISFDKMDNRRACSYLTVIDRNTQEIVYEDYHVCHLEVPYVCGFLGFREVPEYKKLLNKLKETMPSIYPDITIVDGVGVLHYREYGSASHLGVELDIPTIGVSKSLIHVEDLKQKKVIDDFRKTCKKVGDQLILKGGTSNKIYGIALKSSESINPIYVSIGHKVSLDSAIKLVLENCTQRIPNVIRNSDIKSKIYLV